MNVAVPSPPISSLLKYRVPELYPDPDAAIVAPVTEPLPLTVTVAVAPFHVPTADPFKSLTLK